MALSPRNKQLLSPGYKNPTANPDICTPNPAAFWPALVRVSYKADSSHTWAECLLFFYG